jgi:hypothetical protein
VSLEVVPETVPETASDVVVSVVSSHAAITGTSIRRATIHAKSFFIVVSFLNLDLLNISI